jgi:hypothetical protein
MDERDRANAKRLLKLFKIEGVRADEMATEGQLEIFHAIVSKKWDRVQIISSTQYGKSLFIALGCIILSCIEGELVSIVAPTNDKAQIIMRYYIEHLSDHSLFHSQLDKDSNIERLQMEIKKDRITLKNKGGVFTLSVQAGNTQKGFQAAMGEGSKIVIEDEASLIPDEIESTIFRMGAGKKGFMYVKVGNPFYRNHFFKSAKDEKYHQVFIDYNRGIAEGRYTEAFIEEAKGKPFFSVLYGCVFPDENVTDASGWTRLFPDALIDRAQRDNIPYGEHRLGCDIAEGGGDNNALVLRAANHARLVAKFTSPDTMQTAGRILTEARGLEVYDHNLFIDSLGVGKGVFDRIAEQNMRPFSVRFSEKASDTMFSNQRAECYWNAMKWLNEGGTLEPSPDWQELSYIFYRSDSSGRIQIMPKEEMWRKGLHSPDVADAFVSTFARKSVLNQSREEIMKQRELLKNFDFYRAKAVSSRAKRR